MTRKIAMDWVTAQAIHEADRRLPVHQVYVWYITSDRKFLIVSKDGKNWQLPGGKPKAGESLAGTAVRETREETGVAIDISAGVFVLFGYYRVTKEEADGSQTRFLQVRFYLKANVAADELDLSVAGEDSDQAEKERIQYVRTVTGHEAEGLIPWLATSGEYGELELRLIV